MNLLEHVELGSMLKDVKSKLDDGDLLESQALQALGIFVDKMDDIIQRDFKETRNIYYGQFDRGKEE